MVNSNKDTPTKPVDLQGGNSGRLTPISKFSTALSTIQWKTWKPV